MSDNNFDDEVPDAEISAAMAKANEYAHKGAGLTPPLQGPNARIPAMVLKDDLKPTNPKDIMATTRLDLTTFPDTAVIYGALGMTEGHLKYGAHNYRVGGVLVSVYVAAANRHIKKYFNGDWADPKTKVPHLASALACIAILIDAHECEVLKDDRPPRVKNIEELFASSQKLVEHLCSVYPPEDSPGRYTEAEHGEQEHGSTETLSNSIGSGGALQNRSGT